MTSTEVRRGFLAFFERHRHRVVSSSPLVPIDDPTLLFTNAGMNQFKDVFLGRERREYTRAASSQKCMRVSGKHNDLDNVGPSLRHHTFFEMLGNFSFGDYFKQEAIPLAWQLLTEVWRLPPDRLYATVFKGEAGIPRDVEAHGAWRQLLPSERIAELGLEENFWAMGDTGPCGRCSEIHYFRGDQIPCPEPRCRGLECGCDRFVEIWNNVFMEFDRQPDGTMAPLPAPSIDTGMGLERIVAVLQNKLSNYDTDLFEPLLQKIAELTGVAYGPHAGALEAAGDVSMRVVADHMRATMFLIADGVLPSNEWRGYVLRKIMRRAMRHGKKLGLTDPFLYRLVDVLVDQMGEAYPELRTGRDSIVQIVHGEEERFDAVLNRGLPKLEEAIGAGSEEDRRYPRRSGFPTFPTPTGCRETISRIWPASAVFGWTVRGSSALWRSNVASPGKARRLKVSRVANLSTPLTRPVAGWSRRVIDSRGTRPRGSLACRSSRCSTNSSGRYRRCVQANRATW